MIYDHMMHYDFINIICHSNQETSTIEHISIDLLATDRRTDYYTRSVSGFSLSVAILMVVCYSTNPIIAILIIRWYLSKMLAGWMAPGDLREHVAAQG